MHTACGIIERAIQEEVLFEVSVRPQQLWIYLLQAEQVPITLWSCWQGRVSNDRDQGKFRISWRSIRAIHMEGSQIEVEGRGFWGKREGSGEYQRGIR